MSLNKPGILSPCLLPAQCTMFLVHGNHCQLQNCPYTILPPGLLMRYFFLFGIPQALPSYPLSIWEISSHPLCFLLDITPSRRLFDSQFWLGGPVIHSSYAITLCFIQTTYLTSFNAMSVVIVSAAFIPVPCTSLHAW